MTKSCCGERGNTTREGAATGELNKKKKGRNEKEGEVFTYPNSGAGGGKSSELGRGES